MKKTDDEQTATYTYQDGILRKFLQLSNTMRSVAGQIAIQDHLNYYKFTSMAAFIKSFGYDPFDNLTKKYGNYWYKLGAGRALTQKNTGHYFLNSVSWTGTDSLNHYLWHLIDQTVSINKTISSLARPLKHQMLKPRNKQELADYHSFQNFKQSYPKGRENLYDQHSFDSLTALLLIALMQNIKLNHPRPTSAEKFAYAQFMFLFGYKYRTLKQYKMAHKINLLLSNSKTTVNNNFVENIILIDFDEIKKLRKKGEKMNENFSDEPLSESVKKFLLDEFMSEEIKKYVLAQTEHPCFLES